MDLNKLKVHIKLCRKNLKSKRTKCCAICPFENEICKNYPEMSILFKKKRRVIQKQ